MAGEVGDGECGAVFVKSIRQVQPDAFHHRVMGNKTRAGVRVFTPRADLTQKAVATGADSGTDRKASIDDVQCVGGGRDAVDADVGRRRAEVLGELERDARAPVDAPGGRSRGGDVFVVARKWPVAATQLVTAAH